MKKCVLIGLLLLLAVGRSAAQASAKLPQSPDSLLALLKQPTLPDTMRVDALARLCSLRRETDLAEGRRLGEQGLALARRIHYLGGELNCLLMLFNITASARQYAQAEQLAQQALKLSETAPPRLLPFRVKALQALAGVSNSMLNDFQRAGQYYRQALAVARQLRPAKPEIVNKVIIGLASFYVNRFQMGEATDSVRQQATSYARLGLREARVQHDEGNIGDCLVSLGIIARSTGQLDSAAYFMREAIQAFQHQGNLNSASFAWHDLAFILNNQGKFAAAEAAALETRRLARQVQDTRTEFSAYDELGNAYAGQGKYRQAYEAVTRAAVLNDSLSRLTNAKTLDELQVQFDTERKEVRIKSLTQQQQQERQRLWALAAVLLAVTAGAVVAAILALRLRRSRALLALQNEELNHTRASQDRLYSLVAHDLRSPVVAFSGLADLLQHYVKRQDTEGLAGLGGLIRQTTHNLSELLDTLLNWALSQRGELVPTLRPLPASELLAEVAALYQHLADTTDITLSVEAAPRLLMQADLEMTRTILRNLLSNSLKATPPGGKVTLRASSPGGPEIQLQVIDTSAGLPTETLAQLMGPASKLRVAEKGRGAGLGLLLSRSFAEAQGGHLALANATEGTGTVATLTLPLAPAGANAGPAA